MRLVYLSTQSLKLYLLLRVDKANIIQFFALFAIFSAFITSCSRTTYTGQHSALYPLAENENVTILECSGLSRLEAPEELNLVPCDELFLVHIHCINSNFEELSRECVTGFKEVYNAAYVIVPRTSYFRPGDMLQYVTDYEATANPPGFTDQTKSGGTVSFDVYDTESGEMINTFEVKVETSGLGWGNRNDRGYTRINMVPDDSNLYKARKKGLKNIAGRIIEEQVDD